MTSVPDTYPASSDTSDATSRTVCRVIAHYNAGRLTSRELIDMVRVIVRDHVRHEARHAAREYAATYYRGDRERVSLSCDAGCHVDCHGLALVYVDQPDGTAGPHQTRCECSCHVVRES